MRNLFIALCFILFTNTVQAANYYIKCYRPPGQRHLYIHEQKTGKHRLFLKKIRTIKDRDESSIYFNNKNILVFKSEKSKKQVVDCWNEHYKNYVRRKKTDLSFLELIFKEMFWDKVENGWR